jgi:hypothetical protein
MNNKDRRLSDHQFSGVLFHGAGGVDPMSEELTPSPEFVTAGASGLYTTTRPSDARRWAWSSGVVALKPTRPLRIAGDISHNPELEKIRRINQYTNEWAHSGDSAGEWYEDEGFPLTEETRDSARDVSEHLASLGYDGHVDSMAEDSRTSSHYVIYDPKVLKPVRMLKRR